MITGPSGSGTVGMIRGGRSDGLKRNIYLEPE